MNTHVTWYPPELGGRDIHPDWTLYQYAWREMERQQHAACIEADDVRLVARLRARADSECAAKPAPAAPSAHRMNNPFERQPYGFFSPATERCTYWLLIGEPDRRWGRVA